MPKATLLIELDNAQDCIEILKSEVDFDDSNISFGINGNMLSIEIDADNAKELMGALGNVVKQIRIIEETSDAIEPV